MSARVSKCPNCGAVLKPSRFARTATCEFCRSVVELDESAVEAQLFRDAYRQWSAPRAGDARSWFRVGDEHWTLLESVAAGEISDVFVAERARLPAERALLKILRDAGDLPLFDLEWRALDALRSSQARGSELLALRIPDPIARGRIEGGARSGAHVLLQRWVPGFEHSLEAVRGAYPRGVDAHVAVWIWRRVLEVLGFVHASGFVHGAVLPQHLLVERGEHGVRLVGYSCADRRGAALAAVVARYESFYPRELLERQRLEPAHDLCMSARCIAFVLGADEDGRVPSSVPGELRALIESAGRGARAGDAWSVHEQLGALSRTLFGPPSFHPLEMPGDRAQPQPR